jgi:hypothetical protein
MNWIDLIQEDVYSLNLGDVLWENMVWYSLCVGIMAVSLS